MPPVLRPSSLSRAFLWSMEETIGTTTLPSVKLRTETSGPVRNSSMTTLEPEAPNLPSSIISLTASIASSLVCAMITPLPRARPSALMTVGMGAVSRYASALSQSSKTSYAAVGMLYFFMRFFEKILEPSMMAALASGPKHGMPMASSSSTQPRTSGSSIATTAKSMAFSLPNFTMAGMSVAPMPVHTASSAMPPLPGSA